jgi:hypothetical protein
MISDRLLCLLVLIIANVSYFFDWQIATHQLKIRKKDFCLNKLCQEYKPGKNASGSLLGFYCKLTLMPAVLILMFVFLLTGASFALIIYTDDISLY